jgi:hypothetical protein
MSPIPFADNFLAGSLLTLLLPGGLLVAIAILFVLAFKRVPTDTPTTSAALPPPEVVAAASVAPTEINPAGPPPGEIR